MTSVYVKVRFTEEELEYIMKFKGNQRVATVVRNMVLQQAGLPYTRTIKTSIKEKDIDTLLKEARDSWKKGKLSDEDYRQYLESLDRTSPLLVEYFTQKKVLYVPGRVIQDDGEPTYP
jgi:hypothetical protein